MWRRGKFVRKSKTNLVKKYQQIRRQKLKREDNTRQKNCQMLREYTRHETLVGKGCTSMQKKKPHCFEGRETWFKVGNNGVEMICVKTSLHMPQTDFGCTYSWATKLNTRRKIPFLRAPFIILYLSYKLRYYTRITSLRKAVTAHVKNVVIFHVCLISPISCWHVTRLSRHLVRLINERKSLHHSQSKVFCQNFFGLWLLNT